MIADIFLKRYPRSTIWFGNEPPPAFSALFVQIAHIVFTDLASTLRFDEGYFRGVHDALAREIGVTILYQANNWSERCGIFLTERYNVFDDRHGDGDTFVKARLSISELMFREEKRVKGKEAREAMARAIGELNHRFREADIPFHYHNGMIQFAQDDLSETRIAEPCWSILSDPKWVNVDSEMKEAFDRADSGRSDAAFYAAKALESTIKIISDDKGWTTGNEKGAANYIDNLVSQKNGRFIEVWEADILKQFFKEVRNPQGHGSGTEAPVALNDYQIKWAIETAMSWIKSLVRHS